MNTKIISAKDLLYAALCHVKTLLEPDQARAIIDREFDPLEKKYQSAKKAMQAIWENYGSGDLKEILQEVYPKLNSAQASVMSDTLERYLEEANRKNISINPARRIGDIIRRYNENLDKCQAEVINHRGRFLALSPEEIDALKMAVPRKHSANRVAYESWAAYKEKFL